VKAELKAALKNIQQLNDNVLEDAFRSKDLHGALRVLHQIEAAISVQFIPCRTAPTKPTRGFTTCIRPFFTTIRHSSSKSNFLPTQIVARRVELPHDGPQCQRLWESSWRASHARRTNRARDCLPQVESQILCLAVACRKTPGCYCSRWTVPSKNSRITDIARVPQQRIAGLSPRHPRDSGHWIRLAHEISRKSRFQKDSGEIGTAASFWGGRPAPACTFDKSAEGTLWAENVALSWFSRNMYFWKNNTDNNAKNMRKELHSRDKGERNLLGLQKSSSFLE